MSSHQTIVCLSHVKLLAFDSLTYRNGMSGTSNYNYTIEYIVLRIMIRAMDTLKQEEILHLKTETQALCLDHKSDKERLAQETSIEGCREISKVLWTKVKTLDLILT